MSDIIARVVELDARGLHRDAIASTLGTSRRTVDLALSWRSKTQGRRPERRPTDLQPLPPPQLAPQPLPQRKELVVAKLAVEPPRLTAGRKKALAALAKRTVIVDPTPEEIRKRAADIRAGWSSELRRARRAMLPNCWMLPTFSAAELRCVDYCEG